MKDSDLTRNESKQGQALMALEGKQTNKENEEEQTKTFCFSFFFLSALSSTKTHGQKEWIRASATACVLRCPTCPLLPTTLRSICSRKCTSRSVSPCPFHHQTEERKKKELENMGLDVSANMNEEDEGEGGFRREPDHNNNREVRRELNPGGSSSSRDDRLAAEEEEERRKKKRKKNEGPDDDDDDDDGNEADHDQGERQEREEAQVTARNVLRQENVAEQRQRIEASQQQPRNRAALAAPQRQVVGVRPRPAAVQNQNQNENFLVHVVLLALIGLLYYLAGDGLRDIFKKK